MSIIGNRQGQMSATPSHRYSVTIFSDQKTMAAASFRFYGLATLLGQMLVAQTHGHVIDRAQLEPRNGLQPNIVTGLRSPAQIAIHDHAGAKSWTYTNADFDNAAIPTRLKSCMKSGQSVTDAHWANNGTSIVAIYGNAAIIVNHRPDDTSKDKVLTFGMCLDNRELGNTHGVSLVPDSKIAIASNSYNDVGNIKIVDISSGTNPDPPFVQELDGIRASHNLAWDQEISSLWAVGTDEVPFGTKPAKALLNRYDYVNGRLSKTPSKSYPIRAAVNQANPPQWPDAAKWWDGGHDITPVPNQRQFLISTDLDLHLFDIASGTFRHGQDAVEQSYLKGFRPRPTHADKNPRGDVKSISLHDKAGALYAQAPWTEYYTYSFNLLSKQAEYSDKSLSQVFYRTRWFAETSGWAGPKQ